MDDWHELPEGEPFEPTEPGIYGRTYPDGTRIPLVSVREVLEALTPTEITDRRELPKDEPTGLYEGQPEKWQSLNRAARRTARKRRRN